MRLFKSCDISPTLAAFDRHDAAAVAQARQARTLSRAIRCGDPIRFVEQMMTETRMKVRLAMRWANPVEDKVPDDFAHLLAQIDESRAVRPD